MTLVCSLGGSFGDSEQCEDDAIPHSRMIEVSLLLSLLSDCKYAVWTDAILRPDNYFTTVWKCLVWQSSLTET